MSDVGGGLAEPEELRPEQGALRLAGPDDDWSRADWEKAASAVLRTTRRLSEDDPDDAVWAALTHATYDGIGVPPLGTPDLVSRTAAPRPRRAGAWDVRVRAHLDTDVVAELERGATSLWMACDEVAPGALPAYLDGVLLDLAPVVLEDPTAAHAEALVALGPLHPDANLGATEDADLVAFARLALGAGVRGVVVDGGDVHEQGASDAQELGWVLARGAQVLRVLEDGGIEPARAVGLIELRVSVTDEQFPSIAKLRALRVLWARLAHLCEVAEPRTRVAASLSRCTRWRYSLTWRAFVSFSTTAKVSPASGAPCRPRISAGAEGPPSLITSPRSLRRARTRPHSPPATRMSPTRSVPRWTSNVATTPRPRSSLASITAPEAGRSGLAFSSRISACSRIASSSLSRPCLVLAETSTVWISPPSSSTTSSCFSSSWRTRVGLASGLSILLMATMIGTFAALA